MVIKIRKLRNGYIPPDEAPVLFCNECGSLVQWHSHCVKCGADLTDMESQLLEGGK